MEMIKDLLITVAWFASAYVIGTSKIILNAQKKKER